MLNVQWFILIAESYLCNIFSSSFCSLSVRVEEFSFVDSIERVKFRSRKNPRRQRLPGHCAGNGSEAGGVRRQGFAGVVASTRNSRKQTGRVHHAGQGALRIQRRAGLGHAVLAQARSREGGHRPGQLHSVSRRVEQGGQGSVRTSISVPWKVLPSHPSDGKCQCIQLRQTIHDLLSF